MIDVDYAGSALIADYERSGAGIEGPHPGQRYPDWERSSVATSHHVLVFGPVTDATSLARLGRRWSKLVQISHDPRVDPVRAGVPAGGVIMVRPDGHIGFRFPFRPSGSAHSARPPPLFVSDSGPGRRSSRRGDGACEWLISLRRVNSRRLQPTPYGVEDAIMNMRIIDALFRSEKSARFEGI